MKKGHDKECTIYLDYKDGMPENGVCTCGYGLQVKREREICNEMYSPRLLISILNGTTQEDIRLTKANRKRLTEILKKMDPNKEPFGG